jgi:hypothetical protein
VDRLEEFKGPATVVGQVDWKAANGNKQVLVRRKAGDGAHLVVVEIAHPAQAPSPPIRVSVAGTRLPDAVALKQESLPSRWHPIKRHKARNNRTFAKSNGKPSTAPTAATANMIARRVEDSSFTGGARTSGPGGRS